MNGLGSSTFARHYSWNRFFFLFLQVLRCFSSLRSLLSYYFTHMMVTRFFSLVEFPHSDIYGSQDICSSPQLFAAYHVLLRLLVPSHSPYALSSLTFLLRISFVLLCQASIELPQRTNVRLRQSLNCFPSNTRSYCAMFLGYYGFFSFFRFNCCT